MGVHVSVIFDVWVLNVDFEVCQVVCQRSGQRQRSAETHLQQNSNAHLSRMQLASLGGVCDTDPYTAYGCCVGNSSGP